MKRLSLTLMLFVLMATLAMPLKTEAQRSNQRAGQTVVGYISDSMCGLKYMSGMGDDKSCTLACAKGGSKFVVADHDHRRVYKLDQSGQEKGRDFAGQKVKVTGRISGQTIRVTAIEPAE